MDRKLSKFLSYVLRHRPDSIGLVMDDEGWVSTDELLKKAYASGQVIDRRSLERVVEENDKKRFSLSDDRSKIRAAQGHSIKVDTLGEPQSPPDKLFHGTATKNLNSILADGIKPGSRTHVHLSLDEETATKVGMRHGKPVVLIIDTKAMHEAGIEFWLSDNGVWLTGNVPPDFIEKHQNRVS